MKPNPYNQYRHPAPRRKKQQKSMIAEILSLQMGICAALLGLWGISMKFDIPWAALPQQAAEQALAQPEIVLPAVRLPKWPQSGPWMQAVEAFLHQYIYDNDDQPMGGYEPVSSAENMSNPPEGSTFRQVTVQGELTTPISGRITSPFGYRIHPITQEQDFHTGIDIAAAEGTAIHAAASGTVVEADHSSSYGNYLILRHSDGFQTVYCHCSRLIAKEGDRVRKGDRIAAVGSTGISTGPHLHFEARVEGQRTDPLWVLPV